MNEVSAQELEDTKIKFQMQCEEGIKNDLFTHASTAVIGADA